MAQNSPNTRKITSWDVIYSVSMGIACLIGYAAATTLLSTLTPRDDDLLGGMWASVATAFVFRDTRAQSLSAGVDRLIATCVSFALCLVYLLVAPPTAAGIPILVFAGTLIIMLLKRREDIITTAITTIVVMVVAIISPRHAWSQPILRLFDTVIGIGVGVACKWIASYVFSSVKRQDDQASGP
jgi:uncharacterized membrane protein YccC